MRSCKELVAESYKYFESLTDIATEIALAAALVNMCQSLMKHSETYIQEHKSKHGKWYKYLINVEILQIFSLYYGFQQN